MSRLLPGIVVALLASPALAGEAHTSMGVGVIVLPSEPPAPVRPAPDQPNPAPANPNP
jgi:hypothetical protein